MAGRTSPNLDRGLAWILAAVTWDDVKGDVIKLDGTKAKLRDIRNVEITPTLRLWLDHARKLNENSTHRNKGLPAFDGPRRMTDVRVVKPWANDFLRHSFVSYGFEAKGWDWTVRNAGHSISTAFEHYRALVTKPDAEAFWKLEPQKEKQIE